jgi:DNA adenine methylase
MTKAVLKYPGSKWSIADWIIYHFPPGYEKMTYLEPYFGSGAVFFNKKRSTIETINDVDGNVVNLFKCIREDPELLARLIDLTPWSRHEYQESYTMTGESFEDARRFLVRCWQAIGTKTSDITGWSNNIKPVDCGKSRWTKLKNEMFLSSDRLKCKSQKLVQIENLPAIDLIKNYNRSYVFIYCDPPYVISTRSGRIYANEMTDDEHIELLKTISEHKAKIMISGYDNEIYREYLNNWNKESIMANTEKGGKAIETIWMNYEPPLKQISMI